MQKSLREKLAILFVAVFPELATFTILSIKVAPLDVFPPIVNFEPMESFDFLILALVIQLLLVLLLLFSGSKKHK